MPDATTLIQPDEAPHATGVAAAVWAWIADGSDYRTGVGMLRRCGFETTYYDRYLNDPIPPRYHAQRLEDDLRKLADNPPDVSLLDPPRPLKNGTPILYVSPNGTAANFTHSSDADKQPYTAKKSLTAIDPTDPPVIAALKLEAVRWLKQDDDLHAQMALTLDAADKTHRVALLTTRMTVVAPALNALYAQIRHWIETDELPTLANTAQKHPLSKNPIAVAEIAETDLQMVNRLWREKLSIEPRLAKIKKQAKREDEILKKFERLKAIHVELNEPFEKELADYLP